jgi:hypothetical protein
MKESNIKRRSFLKMAGAAMAGMAFPFKLSNNKAEAASESSGGANFWKVNPENGQEYFTHSTVNTSLVESEKTIWAKVDGWWQKYPIREFDEEFITWHIKDHVDWYDRLQTGKEVATGGQHTPGIATYSNRRTGRGDSMFHLNNAFKSVTLIPKKENLDEYLAVYEEKLETGGGPYSFDWKLSLVKDPNYWDRSILATTDLYSGQNFVMQNYGFKESHYLLNTMANPVVNVLYMDLWSNTVFPTWEIRCIPVNTHWNDPDADELYQKYRKAVLYPHKVQHGGTIDIIGCIFYVVEEFNNAANDASPGRGMRVVPSYTYPFASHVEYRVKKLFGKV